VTHAGLDRKRVQMYALASTGLVVSAIGHLYIVLVAFPTAIYWLSYNVANYHFGFVRRGLGGELIRIFPEKYYFIVSYALMWAPAIVWLVALAVWMWIIVSRGARTERRIMLALLVPVLPFSISYALYSPHPEHAGMAAVLAFSIALTRVRSTRSRLIVSAVYGIGMAAMALAHEAIPLQLALGAVLAIVVLSRDATPVAQQACSVLAVGPGIVSALLVGGLGHRNLGSQLCTQVPHRMLENPYPVTATPRGAVSYLLGHIDSRSDYHDWMCRYATPLLDNSFADGVRFVTHFGFVPLLGSFVLGLLFFVGSTWMIRNYSGVPFGAFLREIRGKLVSPVLALALMVPVFMTGVDWTRWWVLITFDVSMVYILFAMDRKELEEAPSRRNVLVFVCIVIALAVIPTGAALHVGGSNFSQL